MKGTLFIVSTPIGNLEDITFRALRVLREVDFIAAEDTRHSLKLLTHYGIKKPMISYWSGKEKVRAEEIIDKLLSGHSVALISDAGTPGISDPGRVVVKKAIEERIHIVPVPGPSACITALSVSGLPTDNFTFIGFLPPKNTQRQKILRELVFEAGTLIFYEAPHRLLEALTDMDQIFTERAAAVVKELTKIHEEIFRGTLSDIMHQLEKTVLMGEYVILVEGRKSGRKTAGDDAVEEVLSLMKKGLKRKEAARRIAEAYGLSKKELYDKSLDFFGTEQ
ncbi:MAG: 16S rRNA (cytidine(1402)-2'-O)-methyltransferase [Thermodesulfovibrionales bacterium]|nr:16S rRNA (cytidine(1402)-2'-O)-methyltransferase [Thermodesulfovibrionales bacterium]